MYPWPNKAIPVLLTSLMLTACSSDEDSIPVQVEAGTGFSVKERRSMPLTGASASGDGTLTTKWSQISGPAVSFSDLNSLAPVVTVSSLDSDAQAVLRLTVTDSKGQTATDDITLTLLNNTLPEINTTASSLKEKTASTLQFTTVDDGSVVSVRWEQKSGPTLELTGTESSAISFNSPAVTAATTVNFIVYATDDDAETSSKEIAVTIEPNLLAFNLAGQIDGANFSAGKATLTGTAQELISDIDATGAFSFALQLDDDLLDSVVTINAVAAENSQLKYAAVYSGFSTPASTPATAMKVELQTTSADEKNHKVAVSAVSTALYSLLLSANQGALPENIEKLTFLEKSVNADELMNAAAIVKILTDDKSFTLPEGITDLVDLLTDVDAYNQLFDEITAASPTLISDTIVAITNDPALTPPVNASQLPQFYYETFAAANGFLSRSGSHWNFESNGTGFLTTETGYFPFTWTIDSNKVKVSYDKTNLPYTLSRNVYVPINSELGLTQEQYNWLVADKKYPVDVHNTTLETELTRITTGNSMDTFRVVNKVQRQLRPIQTTYGIVEGYGPITESTSNTLMRKKVLVDTVFTAAEMPGTWAINSYYSLSYLNKKSFSFYLDLLEFKADGSGVGLNTNRTFNWTVVNGELNISFSDQTKLLVKIIDQSGNDLQLFIVAKNSEGQTIAAEADYGFKVNTATVSGSIANKDGYFWQTMINATGADAWDGNRLVFCLGDPLCKDKENYFTPLFGWELRPDNTGSQIADSWPDVTFPPLLTLTEIPLTWKYDSTYKVTFNYGRTVRDVTLLKQEKGILGTRLYVRETSMHNALGMAVQPRINMYEEVSKSYWNDTAPEAASSLSLQRYLKNNLVKRNQPQRKVVQRTLSERTSDL